MTVAIAIERYLSVCMPTSNHECKSYLIPISVVLSILYNIPKFFELETVDHDTYNDNATTIEDADLENFTLRFENENYLEVVRNETIDDLGYRGTPMRLNHWYYVLYVFWSKFLLVELGPWLTLIELNYCIWKKIKEFQRTRRTALGIDNGTYFDKMINIRNIV